MQIIWLASYPRSGNTFVRMLLHSYLFGDTQDLNTLDQRIPGLHKLMARKIGLDVGRDEQKLVKTHFCHTPAHPYHDRTAGFIYIQRNPRDVLLSAARYLGADGSREALREFALAFIAALGAPRWRERYGGTWPEHVASWQQCARTVPHVFVRYEELRSDTAAALARMVRFLGQEPDDARVRAAVDECEIGKMRALEDADRSRGGGFFPQPVNGRFVGEGRSGQSLTGLGEDVEGLYRERFGEVVAPFGYA